MNTMNFTGNAPVAHDGLEFAVWTDTILGVCFVLFMLCVCWIAVFSACKLYLLGIFFTKHRRSSEKSNMYLRDDKSLPFVTIQLPVYNEKYVINRLIDNMMKLDWPKDRFEVQILEDSTDETAVEMSRKKVQEYTDKGFLIRQIRRKDREGFKAGNLMNGMSYVRGDFVAIFDADFLPPRNFLRKTMFYFDDPIVGAVQTRWDVFTNEDYSIITRVLAAIMVQHTRVEQPARGLSGHLCQFNGSSGIWRKRTIVECGGWKSDTLLEDLDMSIRAHLAGWEIKFAEGVNVLSDLPADAESLKVQQVRWIQGQAEVGKKLLGEVWRSHLALLTKLLVTLQLFESSSFMAMYIMTTLSVPLLIYYGQAAEFWMGTLPMIASVGHVSFLFTACVIYPAQVEGGLAQKLFKFALGYPVLNGLVLALSRTLCYGAVMGWFVSSRNSVFVRTPKIDTSASKDSIEKMLKSLAGTKYSWSTLADSVMMLYFFAAVVHGVVSGVYFMIPMHTLLTLGYAYFVLF